MGDRTPPPTRPEDRAILSFRQASDYLGIGRRLLWSMVNRGEIPHFRVGKLIKFHRESLAEWILAAQRKEARR